jgi:hypothetical protein
LPLGQYLVRFSNEGDAEPTAQWLDAGVASRPFRLAGHPVETAGIAATYLRLGFTHIIPEGLDHILFVMGLFLMSLKVRPLLAQVTAFTVAHSITLALSMKGVVVLPPTVVEPAIALSIACIGVENILSRGFRWRRTALVFAFGLLHGLGFAGVLRGVGLPRAQFLPALLSFNAGIELGQLAVIGAAALAVGSWAAGRPWYRARVTVPASAAIALVGLYWTVERIAA